MRYCENCKCERDITVDERKAIYTFRKEQFEIMENYAKCTVCGEDIYDEETANQTLQQLGELYQKKHLMTAEDIKHIRKSTGLTQTQFAKVLKMGEATIKRYETGAAVPDTTQLSVLKTLKKMPSMMIQFYEGNKENLSEQEQQAIEEKLQALTSGNLEYSTYNILRLKYSRFKKKIENGYSAFQPQKLFHMILFFSCDSVLKTKLMKLLWYSDFLMFKRFKKSISGTPYWHMPFGPVPVQHDVILGLGEGINLISIKEEENPETGFTKMIIQSKVPFNPDLFDDDERQILGYIESYFCTFSSRAISEFSHKESGWKETKDEQLISYKYALELQLN